MLSVHELGQFSRQNLDDLSVDALADEVVELCRMQDRIRYEIARRLPRLKALHGYERDGCVTLKGWLRWQCRMTGAAAQRMVREATELAKLPATAETLAEGQIGYCHAAVIANLAARIGTEKMAPAEPILLDLATQVDPGRVAIAAARVEAIVDPDGKLGNAELQHERRWFQLAQTMDGDFVLDGRLDQEGGAILQTALNSLMPAESDHFASVDRADALVEMGRRLLDGGRLPKVAGERPHVTLIVTREMADLEWGGVIPRETCHRYLCDCDLTLIEADGKGRPLSIGRRGRKVPLYLRKAVIARDRGCKFPGCDRPASWCDCHHIIPWEEGGETALDNLVLLCRRHHRYVHEQGWRVFWGEQGELVAMPPLLGVAAGP